MVFLPYMHKKKPYIIQMSSSVTFYDSIKVLATRLESSKGKTDLKPLKERYDDLNM